MIAKTICCLSLHIIAYPRCLVCFVSTSAVSISQNIMFSQLEIGLRLTVPASSISVAIVTIITVTNIITHSIIMSLWMIMPDLTSFVAGSGA